MVDYAYVHNGHTRRTYHFKKQMKKKCGNKLFNIKNDKINKPCKNTFTRLLFLFGGKNEIQRMAHNMA